MTDEDLVYRNEAIDILSEGLDKPVSERQLRRYETYDPPLLPVRAIEQHGKQRRVKYARADVLALKEMRARQARSRRSDEVPSQAASV